MDLAPLAAEKAQHDEELRRDIILKIQNHHNWNGHCGCNGCVNHNGYPFGQNNFMFNYGQTVVA